MAVTLSHCSVICRRVFKSFANSHYWPPHVCPYVCLHVSQDLHATNFREILYWIFWLNCVCPLRFWLRSKKKNIYRHFTWSTSFLSLPFLFCILWNSLCSCEVGYKLRSQKQLIIERDRLFDV